MTMLKVMTISDVIGNSIELTDPETGWTQLCTMNREQNEALRAKIRHIFGFERMVGTQVVVKYTSSGCESIDPIRSLVDAMILHVEREEAHQSAES